MNKCIKCNVELTDDNWYKSCQVRQHYICKNCLIKKSINWQKNNTKKVLKINKKYRNNHPEEYKKIIKESQQKIKLEVLTHYCNGTPYCQCHYCDEKNIGFLTIDHINNDGAEHRKKTGCGSGSNIYQWLKRHNYPDGFGVLCFNCNCGRQSNNGICPHKPKGLN